MVTEKKRQFLIFLIFALAVLTAPFFLKGNYILNVLVFVGINTMLAVGLNLLLGYAGQISLGHAAFFGMGAYISGIITARYPVEPFLIMALAALCVGVIAFVIGFPILKLKGHYLAMATLGFGIIMYIVFNETVDWTGGPSGLSGIPNLQIGALVFDNDWNNYYLVWMFTLAVMLFSINLSQSRIGRALRAIHDSEVAARVMGVNARILKVQIFTVSAVISALAGSLYAHIMTFIAPASFGFNFSVELLTMIVIGGLGSIYGSFLGAAILTMLPEFLRVFQDFDIIIYGLMLILMTMFMPGGLISGIGAVLRFIAAKCGKAKDDDHAEA
ncbi:MAG TPA: branched-chain amino acid ABC transporter permease [Smithella sp.]|nr:branched-chain amino acid ABC transporter permease [Smithella sp.]MDM7986878.1 branched-chain amino acid ABC transporter permease [Smithella sp.]HNY49894.1 branched-chain amino acid ABC transporter permease [Smithella sp.]HOG89706.1 branched-chain amino acid ABC transporter permease [Smithella sp.]HOU50648.1 branched-chain amino acid ABC transporter permease [Smithella sp.]